MSVPNYFDPPIIISVTITVVILAFILATILLIRRISMSIDNVGNEIDNLRLCLDRHLDTTDVKLDEISVNTYNTSYTLAKDYNI
jgi:hypothetical protein